MRALREDAADIDKTKIVLSYILQMLIVACYHFSLLKLCKDHNTTQLRFSSSFPELEAHHEQLALRQQNAQQCLHLLRISRTHDYRVASDGSHQEPSTEDKQKQLSIDQRFLRLEHEASFLCSSISRHIDRLMREMAIFKAKVSIEADRASLVHTKASLSQSESVNRLTKLDFVFMYVSMIPKHPCCDQRTAIAFSVKANRSIAPYP